jgi:hypothetical protein
MAVDFSHLSALAGGYQAAFLCGAGFALLAALIGAFLLREIPMPAAAGHAIPSTSETE